VKSHWERRKKTEKMPSCILMLSFIGTYFQLIAGNNSERSNTISAVVKKKIKADAEACLVF
jgi:hypothetical protein